MNTVKPEEMTAEITLYYYTAWEYAQSNLINNRVKLSEKGLTNDAQDYSPIMPDDPVKHERLQLVIDKAKSRFISFSQTCHSKCMWQKYGDNYRGVCLVFKLPTYVCKCLLEKEMLILFLHAPQGSNLSAICETPGLCLMPVFYVKELVDANQYSEHLCDAYAIAATRKLWQWKYEREIRCPIRDEDQTSAEMGGNQLHFSDKMMPFLTGIIVGPSFEGGENTVRECLTSCNRKNLFVQNSELSNANGIVITPGYSDNIEDAMGSPVEDIPQLFVLKEQLQRSAERGDFPTSAEYRRIVTQLKI